MNNKQFKAIPELSHVEWVGRKVTGAHNGTIELKEGTFEVSDGKLTGGQFVIDTTSIKILDIEDAGLNAQMAGHLASDDFFSSTQYPEATFKITAVNDAHIEGDLTIKGITHPIGFDATVSVEGDTLTASGVVEVDRTLYGIKFRSGNFFQNLGDTLIYNQFDLNLTIIAKAA